MRPSRRQVVQGVGIAGLALLGGCGRLPFQAEPAAKVHRISNLSLSSGLVSFREAFREGLREHGYQEGKDLLIEYRSADGRQERLPDLAAELAHLPVDVIVVGGVEPAQAARNVTTTIPIVLTTSTDPGASRARYEPRAPGHERHRRHQYASPAHREAAGAPEGSAARARARGHPLECG